MKKFITDVILEAKEICNLETDFKDLTKALSRGDRMVFMGRRNTGKTSLIQGRVVPAYRKIRPEALILFVDLMGTKSLEQINQRFQTAFEAALSRLKPTQSFLQGLVKALKRVRPHVSIDPISGETTFSLGLEDSLAYVPFEKIIAEIGNYHQQQAAVIIMDEFQDIAAVAEAEAKFRNALQKLPGDLPVLILGSKKHILAEIFAAPRAPLANWGRVREISAITADERPSISITMSSRSLSFSSNAPLLVPLLL